jgi:hypothetical protein
MNKLSSSISSSSSWSKSIPIDFHQTSSFQRNISCHPFNKGTKRKRVMMEWKEIVAQAIHKSIESLEVDTIPGDAATANEIDKIVVSYNSNDFKCIGCEQLENDVRSLKDTVRTLIEERDLRKAEILIRDSVQSKLETLLYLVRSDLRSGERPWEELLVDKVTLGLMNGAYRIFKGHKIPVKVSSTFTRAQVDELKDSMIKVLSDRGLEMDDFYFLNERGRGIAQSVHAGDIDIDDLKRQLDSLRICEADKSSLFRCLEIVSRIPEE